MTNSKINKYENGKIYTIRSHQTKKYYIGSTCSPLHKRLYEHKTDFRSYNNGNTSTSFMTSYEIVKYDDCYIELYEYFPCNTRAELLKREGECIRANKKNVVNICIPTRTRKQWKADNNEKLNERILCYCGKSYTRKCKADHERTRQHMRFTMKEEKLQWNKLMHINTSAIHYMNNNTKPIKNVLNELEQLEQEFNNIGK